MLKISDFAQIAQVSVSALRYYDEMGIFKPREVDPATGYRFYTMDQLVQLNRILALKDLGINLRKIVKLLNDDLPDQTFYELLKLRQAQLEQTIEDSQEQLARIQAQLNRMLQTDAPSLPEVVIKSVQAQSVITSLTYVEGFLPNVDYTRRFMELLAQHRIKPTGYTHYIYHMSTGQESIFDIELAIPIEAEAIDIQHLNWEQTVHLTELPAVSEVASVVYQGNPYGIFEAYQALGLWIQQNNYAIAGPCRKCCLQWSGALDTYLTEIQFPINTTS